MITRRNLSGIGNHQKPNIVAIEDLYKQYNETLYPFLVQLKESKTCLETIKKWCDAVSLPPSNSARIYHNFDYLSDNYLHF